MQRKSGLINSRSSFKPLSKHKSSLSNLSLILPKKDTNKPSVKNKAKRKSSLSNKKNNNSVAREKERKSKLPPDMNLYNRYKASKTKDYQNLKRIKTNLTVEVDKIKKGFSDLLKKGRKERKEKQITQERERVPDNFINTERDYGSVSFYKRHTDLGFRKTVNYNKPDGQRPSLLNRGMRGDMPKRKSSLANIDKNKGMHSHSQITGQKEYSLSRNDDMMNRESVVSNLIKSEVYNTKQEKGIRKKKSGINLNLNLKFEIGDITNGNLNKNIQIGERNQQKQKLRPRQTDITGLKSFQESLNTTQIQRTNSQDNPLALLSKGSEIDDIKSIHSIEQTKTAGDYFCGSMLKTLQNKIILGKKKDIYSNEVFFHHFKETFLHFSYLNKIDLIGHLEEFKDLNTVNINQSAKGVLVLDLDETLIHCSYKKGNNEAVEIYIEDSKQAVS